MIKQQVEARRAVTETDLQLVDKAIADHETFQKDLYVLRRVLGEVGNLDQAYRGMKEGIAQVQADCAAGAWCRCGRQRPGPYSGSPCAVSARFLPRS
jgi:hypothetical protein